MARRLPVLDWLPNYRWRDLPADLLSGVLATLSAAPEAMAYALLAGLPAQMGLYSLLLPLLVYFVLGTSRELSVAPTAPLAALLAVTVAPVAGGDPARSVALALLVTCLVGALLLAAGLLRLGFMANFVSRPVLTGYMAGAALLIAASQLGAMFEVSAKGLNLPAIARAMVTSWERARFASAGLGLGLLALLFAAHRRGLKALGPALVVAAGTLSVAVLHLETAVVGRIPAGLPPFALPAVGATAVGQVLVGAVAIAALVFLDSAAMARHFAGAKGYRVEPDQELRALGAANLAAGVTGAAPTSGSLADSVLLAEAGARSPVAGLVTVVLVLVLVLTGADFANVPLAAFGAIVVHGVLRPPHLALLRQAWRFDRTEFALGVICLLGVLGIGLVRGLLLALALTALVLLSRASRPRVIEVGYVLEPSAALVDRERSPSARRFSGAVVVQPIGGLFFASAPAVTERIRDLAEEAPEPLRLAVLDLRAVPFIDLTACGLLDKLQRELAQRNIRLLAARANGAVDEKLRRYGLAPHLELPGGRDELLDALGLPHEMRDLT